MPDDLQLVPTNALPDQATWFSTQMWDNRPPSPFNWLAGRQDVLYYQSPSFGTNKIIIDDTQVSYPAIQTSSDGPPFPGDGNDNGTNYDGRGYISPNFGPGDIWLSITNLQTGITNYQTNYFLVTLHGATNHYVPYWQLLSNAMVNVRPWGLGEIQSNPGTNDIYFDVITNDKPASFFWAAGADTIASIATNRYTNESFEPCSTGETTAPAQFTVSLSTNLPFDLTVYYVLTGTAINGVDYTNLPGSVVVTGGQTSATIYVQPLHDSTNYPDFDETVTATLVLSTNDYVIDPNQYVASVTIHECLSNLLEVVAINVPAPVAIDYSPTAKALLLAINLQDIVLTDPAFGRLDSNGVFSSWSSLTCAQVTNSDHEVRIATVKVTTNGFTAGDLFFGNDAPGGIGWVSADGSSYDLNWARNSALTNESDLIQAIYFDETGIWGNDMLVVCGQDTAAGGNRDIWRVHSRTNVELVASLPTAHLEGALTLPNDSRYGPLASMLISGDEGAGSIFAISTNGVYTNFSVGIDPDCFRLIPTNSDLYCVYFNQTDYTQSEVLKLKKECFTNYVGDIVVERAGEPTADTRTLFIVHWDGTNFVAHSIPLAQYLPDRWNLEKLTFAPISLPPVQ